MRIIKIKSEANGGHAYQTIDRLSKLPSGWAVIPMVTKYTKTEEGVSVENKEMDLPNLPYGDLTIEIKCGVPTVTSWTPREMPEVPETEAVPTAQDDTDAIVIDHEYRLTLLELEV